MACVLCRPEDLCNPGLHRYGRQSCIGLRRQNRRHQDDNNGNGILEGQTSSQNLIALHLLPSNSPSPGSLPGLHYNVERPNRNSTSRCEKFCFREFFSSACGFGAISPGYSCDPRIADQLNRPSSAEGPYSAGTDASLRRRYTVNCPRWWARWLNTESAIMV